MVAIYVVPGAPLLNLLSLSLHSFLLSLPFLSFLLPFLPPSLTHPISPSSFAQDNLPTFTLEQLDMYDHLINQLENDWDLYYCMTGKEVAPEGFDNDIMSMLKEHARNVNKEKRYFQPELYK